MQRPIELKEDYFNYMKSIIFISIPRTGTRSIRQHLNLPIEWDHCKPEYIINQIGKEKWSDAFKFCFVRNPYDRLVSWYHFHRKHKTTKRFYKRFDSFSHWVEEGLPHHWNLRDAHPNPLHLKGFISYDMDFIGRVENFQADFDQLCETIGYEKKPISKVNSSKHKNYRACYTPKTIEIVKDIFHEDLERFGYSF